MRAFGWLAVGMQFGQFCESPTWIHGIKALLVFLVIPPLLWSTEAR